MKNSIVIKFIAIFLCAAALLGAVGSGLGIGALSARGLYDRSLEEVYDDRMEDLAISFANEAAIRYASTALGGCSTQLVDDYYGTRWFYSYFDWGSVGYAIRDAEGNTVYEERLEDQKAVRSYQFVTPVQYMKLLSQMPLEEYEELTRPTEPEEILYDAIPPEGCSVTGVYVAYADGFAESAGGAPDIGWLGYDEIGRVIFRSNYVGLLEYRGVPVTHISFHCGEAENSALVYEASSPEGVGGLAETDGTLVFLSWAENAGIDSEGTEPVKEFEVYDDVPPVGCGVYQVQIYLKDNGEYIDIDTGEQLGVAERYFGNVVLRCDDWEDFVFSKPAQVCFIRMTGEDGRLLYEAGEPGQTGPAVGTFAYDEGGVLTFTAASPATAAPAAQVPTDPTEVTGVPETTVPEATVASETTATIASEETVPETTGEAVPETGAAAAAETTGETVPETTAQVVQETTAETVPDATALPSGQETGVEATVPEIRAGELETRAYNYYDHELGELVRAEYAMESLEGYTVEVYLGRQNQDAEWLLLELAYGWKTVLPMVLGVGLLVFAIMAVYLCCAAGRRPGTAEVHAGGLNCIPLDLYLVVVSGGVALMVFLCAAAAQFLLGSDEVTGLTAMGAAGFTASLLVVAFCFACAAQFKTPGGYWWRNSLCGRCLRLAGRFLRWCLGAFEWLDEKAPPVLGRIFRKLWAMAKSLWRTLWGLVVWTWKLGERILLVCWSWVKKTWSWGWRKVVRFCGMLPLTWQWVLGGLVLLGMCMLVWANRNDGWGFVWLMLAFGLILFVSHCFGILHEAAKRMSKGDLDEQVNDKMLVGCFQEFAQDLNSLAGVAVIAAQKQLKSERMKTELITNVSHDIKTPLTSIINYVDLLQKPHTDAEQEQYLEVLDRQSQRLKKLIEDLMEMSKASTGNLAVDITKVDAAEAINQALGEFAGKLEGARLTPVFRQPDDPILMMADGRLVWRVMSNLLGNAVKYALPGTRLYLDLVEVDGKVILSMKNISREELNVNADELLERFVRGDASRNTEGSGLGLNIARSLMELQKGQLQLLVDGDLFKVTLIFPGA